MSVDHVKSTAITALDGASGIVTKPTTGEGGPGYLQSVQGSATVVASSSAGATYQLVRVPSNAKVKKIWFESAAQAAGKFDIGVFYATDGHSGPAKATSLLVADAIDADFFASAIDCASAVAITDITNESTTNTIAKRAMPLWQAVGLSADPMCLFDIVASVITTDVTTGTGVLGIELQFTL